MDVEEQLFGDVDARSPTIVTLHGRGGVPGLPSLAYVRHPVRVLVPSGPHALAGGRAWSLLSATSGRDDALAEDLLRSAAMLDDVIGDRRRVILAGYSQGAMTAFALAAIGTRPYELVLARAGRRRRSKRGSAPRSRACARRTEMPTRSCACRRRARSSIASWRVGSMLLSKFSRVSRTSHPRRWRKRSRAGWARPSIAYTPRRR